MKGNFQIGMEIGIANFRKFKTKGNRWHSRNTPKWILEYMQMPYFITESEGYEVLYILQLPNLQNKKVHFFLFSTRERATAISNST
jgi:hypothetical protein